MSAQTTDASTATQMPNIEDYAAYGFLPSKGNLSGAINKIGGVSTQCSPIFDITFSTNTITWGPAGNQTTYSIPDQANTVQAFQPVNYKSSQSIVCETVADWKEKITGSFSGSFQGVGDDFSGSGSTKISGKYSTNVFEKLDSYYFIDFYVSVLDQVNMNLDLLKNSMTSEFNTAINALPQDLSTPTNRNAYLGFLAKYGTHFLSSAVLGGVFSMQASVTKSLVQTQTKSHVQGQIDGAFSTGLDSGSVSISASYTTSSFVSNYQSDVTIAVRQEGESNGDKNAWTNGLFTNPFLVYEMPGVNIDKTTQLLPVSSLVSGTVASLLDDMIKVYLRTPLFDSNNIISKPIRIPSSKLMTASGNCMLTANADETSNVVVAQLTSEGTAMNPPLRSSFNYLTNARSLASCGLAFPISNTDQYGFSLDINSGTASGSGEAYAFQNLPEGQVEQLTLQTIDSANYSSYTPSSDGFIMAQVDWNNSAGACGNIQLQDSSGTLLSAASVHNFINTSGGNDSIEVPVNSFCYPVKTGQVYNIVTNTTTGTPSFGAYFMELASGLELGNSASVPNASFNNPTPAGSDGFLVAYIDSSAGLGQGCMARVNLKSAASGDSMITRNSCSAQYQLTENTNVPYNAALLPVPNGWDYQVEMSNNVNNCAKVHAVFIPLQLAN